MAYKINIPSVTGDVCVTASAIANFTNLVGEYQDGYRINSSGGLTADSRTVVSGKINMPDGKTLNHIVRIGGSSIKWDKTSSLCGLCFYDANDNMVGSRMNASQIGMSQYYPVYDDITDDSIVQINFNNLTSNKTCAYIRVFCFGRGTDFIVTLDEAIE